VHLRVQAKKLAQLVELLRQVRRDVFVPNAGKTTVNVAPVTPVLEREEDASRIPWEERPGRAEE
jgi:hypothetical protein